MVSFLPGYVAADKKRLNRQRSIGGGPDFELKAQDQILLTVVWLCKCPTHEALGRLFGVSGTTAGRYIRRILPLPEAAVRDTMCIADPGRKRRRHLANLLQKVPELAAILDTLKSPV